jgi:hypothetical protein
MKKIRVLVDYPVVINKMTVDAAHPMDIWNEEILNSQDVKDLLKEKKIEIVDDATQAPG